MPIKSRICYRCAHTHTRTHLTPHTQLIRFSGVALGEACSIVIRGATQQILDESERSLHDALCVLQVSSQSLHNL